MLQSTITDRFQTTIPVDVHQALKLQPRKRLSYEVRQDRLATIRAVPRLDELFGSVQLNRPAASIFKEKEAAWDAVATQSYTAILD